VKIPNVSVAVYLPKCTESILVPEMANDVIDDGVDADVRRKTLVDNPAQRPKQFKLSL
jgi:hypothetical protein